MSTRILVINGHPDPAENRACTALANAYCEGAVRAGREIRRIDIGALSFPLIRSERDFVDKDPPPDIRKAQTAIAWADHLVIVFPLWLGGPPALLKGFLEQTFRYGFAVPRPGQGAPLRGLLAGRTARLIVTMGMPAPAYRWMFGAFGVRAVERSILWLSGLRRFRRTLIGGVGAEGFSLAASLERTRRLGAGGG